MYYVYKIFIPVLFCMYCSYQSIGQTAKHGFSLYVGYAYGQPDKRVDFLYDQYPIDLIQSIINNSDSATLDDEYSVGVNYKYKLSDRFIIGIGLGYTQLVQDFLLPANGKYFEEKVYIFFWRDISYYHMIQVSPEIQFDVLKYKFFSLGINTRMVSNISFRKEIRLWNLSVNKTEYFATEFYPGIYLGMGRVRFDVHYRAKHWKYRDDGIANNGLNPDRYNPAKWRFGLGFRLL